MFLKSGTHTTVVAGDVRSPPPLLLCLLLCCCCGVPVVVSTVVVVLPSRLCDDEALSRTRQARYAVVDVFVIIC